VRVTVRLFARPREVAGTGTVAVDLPEGATAGDAFEAVARLSPGLAALRPSIRSAIDGEYRPWETQLTDGAEVALIPPTAGG
jgi:molybdopterin converting factor small subunit